MTPRRMSWTIAAALIALIGAAPGAASASGSALGPPAAPTTAPFQQCAAVFLDPSCGYLIDITTAGNKVLVDPTIGYYEGSDDVLVGVQNDSSVPVSSIHVGIPGSGFGSFGFDGDGLCTPGGQPVPADCPFGPIDPTNPAAGGDYFGPDATLTVDTLPCPGLTSGPCIDDGTVSFPTALQPGQYTYFSLEAPFTGATVVAGTQNDVISTSLSDGTNSGVHLVDPSPTAITDTASILPSSINGSSAGGSVTYSVYSDAACTTQVAGNGPVTFSGGSVPPSAPFGASLPTNAIYYVQATYISGGNFDSTTTNCGDETVTFGTAPVKPKATITTSLVGSNGATGALLAVPTGTAVHDTASVTANGAAQSGRITYYIYSDSSCTTQVPGANLGSGAAVNGIYPPSVTVTLPTGTYYAQAIYSGNATYAPGVSQCRAEVLSVKTPTSIATALTASGKAAGAAVTVQPLTAVSDTATVLASGALASGATGAASYALYNAATDPKCSKAPAASFNASVLAGTATPFQVPIKPGKWFIVASYAGDQLNLPSASACAGEVITVLPAKATIKRTSVSKGTITTALTVNDPGKISITAVALNAKAVFAKAHRCKSGKTLIGGRCVSTLFGTASLTVTAVGTYKIKLHPDKAAKRALARGHTIKVKETITVKPKDGTKGKTTTVTVKVRG
jgi:VCBS repeat-containing protein